jgi:hypothetical protein
MIVTREELKLVADALYAKAGYHRRLSRQDGRVQSSDRREYHRMQAMDCMRLQLEYLRRMEQVPERKPKPKRIPK